MSAPSLPPEKFAPDFRTREARVGVDDALLQDTYALRYTVYCAEKKFLSAQNYPGLLESDEFDAQAGHFSCLNLRDEFVGYVRLVRAGTDQEFPFRSHCKTLPARTILPQAFKAAEISRLRVRGDYRRRRGDTLEGVTIAQGHNNEGHGGRKSSPQILLGLYREMYGFSIQNRIRYGYAAMEAPLARSLKRLSFIFEPIGPPIDYFGPVAPFLADLHVLEARLAHTNPALMAWMRSAADRRLLPAAPR